MAIHDAGMFTVKEINRLKILHDVIDRGPGLLNLALTNMLSLTASRMVYAAVLFFYRLKNQNQNHSGYSQPTSDNKDENVSSAYCRSLMPTSFLNFLDMATWLHRRSCYLDSCHQDNAGLILGSPRCSPSFLAILKMATILKMKKLSMSFL
ncbi:hypothetical protein [Klebsiella oxytoca]|uniref:hypothetical protein n=1 Tax=Klebsiella oxytoca TaxID=571 RepID=UPI00298606B3|nr:hypothetical protein [Klebsiella oxytoca]MEB2850994.1 hypothetical protein [Klebsiella oxytoca]MEB2877432.1 hypothetical protein [Klebsiella oxytoca]HEG4358125.1 hypothetical protein [Klebsiella oxytoca]HEG4388741.1 hypothetical protein [Klebsiella oxytoca]